MLIDTNGFEIGDEVWVVTIIGNGNGNCVYIYDKQIIWAFHYYNEKHKLYIETVEEGQRSIKYCFHTEQQAIDYCNHMNGELC